MAHFIIDEPTILTHGESVLVRYERDSDGIEVVVGLDKVRRDGTRIPIEGHMWAGRADQEPTSYASINGVKISPAWPVKL